MECISKGIAGWSTGLGGAATCSSYARRKASEGAAAHLLPNYAEWLAAYVTMLMGIGLVAKQAA